MAKLDLHKIYCTQMLLNNVLKLTNSLCKVQNINVIPENGTAQVILHKINFTKKYASLKCLKTQSYTHLHTKLL